MSDFRFGADDYKLNYYPHEASDGMGGVDWGKVESVEIEFYTYVKERTCRIVEYDAAVFGLVCSECGAVQPDDFTVYYCWNCGAKVVE